MVVRKTQPLPIECVVRGYVSGSGWKDYRATGKICGIALPAGAHCPGDTEHKGYRVWSYLVPGDVELRSVSFAGLIPEPGYPLKARGDPFGPANTAQDTGQIVRLPNDFVLSDLDLTPARDVLDLGLHVWHHQTTARQRLVINRRQPPPGLVPPVEATQLRRPPEPELTYTIPSTTIGPALSMLPPRALTPFTVSKSRFVSKVHRIEPSLLE